MGWRTLPIAVLAAFLMAGVMTSLVSAFSPVTAAMGTGSLALAIGLFPAVKRARSVKTVIGDILVVAAFGAAIVSAACAPIKVPLEPKVGKLELGEPFSGDAVLFISEDAKNYVYSVKPESFTGGARQHEFPLGEALEIASLQTFPQVFQNTFLVRTSAEAEKHAITIEPKIEEFHFRYDQMSYAGFAVAVFSKAKVRVSVSNKGKVIWEKTVESPEQKKGPWVFNTSYEKDVGEAASDAIVFSMKEIAAAMYKDAEAIRSKAESP